MAHRVLAALTILLITALLSGCDDGGDSKDVTPSVSGTPMATPGAGKPSFSEGRPWDRGEGGSEALGNMSERDLVTFSDYPLYWLGPNFAGFNLQAVVRQRYQNPVPKDLTRPAQPATIDNVTFIYGDCEATQADEKSCTVPLTLHIHPICEIRPEWVPEQAKSEPYSAPAGQPSIQRFKSGHVVVWTATIAISLDFSADPANVDRALKALVQVGASRAVPEGSGIGQAPNFSGCPK